MSSASNNEIRHRMLDILHQLAERTPGSAMVREQMQTLLGVSRQKMDFNMLYLEEKGLVKLQKVMGSLWYSAAITAFGTDVIEDKERFGRQFPFVQTTIQQIQGDVYGNVIQAVQSEVSFVGKVTSAFKNARAATETKEDLPGDLRKEINKHLDILEGELKKEEPDAGKIQKGWKWLKRKANWLVPILTQIVLEAIKKALET